MWKSLYQSTGDDMIFSIVAILFTAFVVVIGFIMAVCGVKLRGSKWVFVPIDKTPKA
jgi:hypothetical protein